MRKITSPLSITFLLAILIFLFNFTKYADIANYFGISIVLLFFTLLIHELGHMLFGIWSGYRFNYLTVGPLTIENTNRFQIKINNSWFFVGGVASCSPLSSNLATIASQHRRFVAGGPIFSIVIAIVSFLVGNSLNINWITYFGVFNFLIFLATIIPYQGAIKSDGRVLLELSKQGKEREEFLISLLLLKEMNSPIHPTKWSIDLIEQAKTLHPTIDNVMVCYILFYYTLIQEGYESASKLLDPFKQLPVTKDNKMALQFIHHIKQIDLMVEGNYDEALIRELHQHLKPIEPLSYKRSQAVLAKLEGNDEEAMQKISEVINEIEKGKNLFGFFYAEELLTKLLKTKLTQ
ncbi:peptidase M50-like protein [Ureibacillus xyleni]|uniref:Peptidase M50-like protein n=1 Tax=Ureibacillus xyleni TaxID=614648 RepID=A0A285SXL0_9BACL|nr:site-2 protease family protein [Ureibacillus xyleni]SOC13397.1 peptidase M50-like protein [Ureibacillus xyleni]